MYRCWKCENPLELEGRVGRQQLCPHCTRSLHSCRNCDFWDTGAHNQCREPNSVYVADRESGNFCDYFFFRTDKPKEDSATARAQLEAAFASQAAKGKRVVTPASNDPRHRLERAFGGSGTPDRPKVVQTEKDAKKALDDLFKLKSKD